MIWYLPTLLGDVSGTCSICEPANPAAIPATGAVAGLRDPTWAEGMAYLLSRGRRGAAVGLLALLWLPAAGCEKGATTALPSPSPFAGASAVSAGVATLDSVLATAPVLGLLAMGGLMQTASAAETPAGSAALACVVAARSAASPVTTTPPPAAAASDVDTTLIPDTVYGHVFVYDTAAGTYRLGSDTGGPAQGVRFLIYAVNSYDRPLVPLATVGWLDLSDRSTTGSLAALAHLQGATAGLADYLVTLSGTRAADTAVLSGAITDGAHTFTWRDSTAHAGFITAIAAALTDSAAGVQLRMYDERTSFDPFDFNDTLDFSYAHGAETVRVTGLIQTYCLLPSIVLAVSVDSQPFATVTNSNPTVPSVAAVNGGTLTSQQVQAILDLQDGQQRLYQALFALFTPVGLLLPT